MRIAVWLVDASETAGGGYTFQRDVAESLAAGAPASHHQLVYLCSPSFELGPIAAANNVTVRRVRETRLDRARDLLRRESRIAETLLDGSAVADVLEEEKIDFLVNLTHYRVHTDVPYSVVVWDLQHRLQPWFPEVSEQGEWSNREATFRWLLPRATFVICGTKSGAAEVEQFYRIPREHIRLLPHPTPRFALDAPPHDESLARYGITRPFLFYPAQFWPHKNHVNLLHALQRLPDLELDVVFTGSDQGNMTFVRDTAASLGLGSRTHILGFVSTADLVALYRQAFALAYVTFFGPENLPPLEAFALGCPVIASNVSGAEEQLGDAALFVDPRSPDAIAAAVRRLHDDAALRETLVERGRARATQWTGADFANGLFAMLDEFESVRRCWPAGRLRKKTQ